MAKPGPKVGWAQKLREELDFQKRSNANLRGHNAVLVNRICAYNVMSKWQKLLFAIKGCWI